jgi:hypothetical protein
MRWPNWVATVPSCVSQLTRALRHSQEATFVLEAYPLGWRTFGVPCAIEQLTARGFHAWADGDVVHAMFSRRAAHG